MCVCSFPMRVKTSLLTRHPTPCRARRFIKEKRRRKGSEDNHSLFRLLSLGENRMRDGRSLSLSLSLKRATTTTTSWSSFGFVLSHPLEGKGPTRFLVSSRPPSSLGRERREGPAFLLFRKAISVHSSDSLSLSPRSPARLGWKRQKRDENRVVLPFPAV